jgi:hypothetical protein
MNERAQFEYHPDADQIGAFLEQALPDHEREQMLGHLAVCTECRTVVALSAPEIVAPAEQPLLVPARRPWWAGWAVTWPVAGAVAALAFLIFYMHSATPGPSEPQQQQIAVANSPAAPGTQGQASTSSTTLALRSQTVQPQVTTRADSPGKEIATARRSGETANAAHAVGGAALTGRDAAELIKMAPAVSPVESARVNNEPVAGSENSTSNSANNAMSELGSSAAGNAEGGLQLKAPAPTLGTVNGPAPVDAAAAPQPASSSTVSVAAANEPLMDTVSADAASVEIAPEEVETALLKHPLPSRLAVLSMAVQGRFAVAIDTRSAVFMSNDAGKHWKVIAAPWQGRALKAALVVPPAGRTPGMSLASAGAFQSNRGTPARPAIGSLAAQTPAPSASGSSITGTVTDPTGAVVAGANIVVTEIATGTAHRVRTDGTGRYLVDGLAPGTYGVEARASGFKVQSLAAVAAAPNRQTVADLSLTISASSQSVTVTGADVMEATDAKKKPATPIQPAPIFEITTDNGERWASADGVAWTRM